MEIIFFLKKNFNLGGKAWKFVLKKKIANVLLDSINTNARKKKLFETKMINYFAYVRANVFESSFEFFFFLLNQSCTMIYLIS